MTPKLRFLHPRKFVCQLFAAASLVAGGAHAQSVPAPAARDTARLALAPGLLNPVSLQSYEAFRAAVHPLVQQMARKKVVALGEGTHGTAEFYRLRFWLTRLLVEEHGFNQVALENDYTDTYLLGEELRRPGANLPTQMQAHLYSIWQNQETAELLAWLQHCPQPVRLRGIDGAYLWPEARELAALAARYPCAGLGALATQLAQTAAAQDSMWDNMNTKGYSFPRERWLATGLSGYRAAAELEQRLATARLPRHQRSRALAFVRDARRTLSRFDDYANHKRDTSRDSLMAVAAASLVQGKADKIVVWAHNGHISRRALDPTDDNGGGTGSFLERLFPGQYFALGTSTATGTFAATTDPFITRTSLMGSYALQKPLAGSWEASLGAVQMPVFYLETRQLSGQDVKRPLRFVGYNPDSGQKTCYDFKLADAFDALLFVRQTTAATPLH